MTIEEIKSLQIGKTVAVECDWQERKNLRQLIYNHQKKFVGCQIDTSQSFEIPSKPGFYMLLVTRKSFGKTPKGEDERPN